MTAVHSTIDNRQSTIPALRSTPNSSTAKQHQTLVIAASHKGLDLHEVRKMVGGSLRRLSAKECSEWIERFSGKGLPHPPGAAPPAYPRRRRSRSADQSRDRKGVDRPVPRMILTPYVDQIGRLMLRYFENNPAAAIAWFRKHWKCDNPRELGTTERAGQVIAALNRMLGRKDQSRRREPGDVQNRDRNGADQ